MIQVNSEWISKFFKINDSNLLFCIPLKPSIRIIVFNVFFITGITLLIVTIPLTGIYENYEWLIFFIYILGKIFIMASFLFLGPLFKQLMSICRPIRFCSISFHFIAVSIIWLMFLFHYFNISVFICSVVIELLSIIVYCDSYLNLNDKSLKTKNYSEEKQIIHSDSSSKSDTNSNSISIELKTASEN